jgi:hypothetical protein
MKELSIIAKNVVGIMVISLKMDQTLLEKDTVIMEFAWFLNQRNMIFKYISFLIGIIWSYSIIKTQSVFSKKTGIIFKIFITKISWFSLIAACYFGYKNFTVKSTVIGIIIGVLLVNVGFHLLKKYINQRFNEKQITTSKSFFEYTLIFLVIYFVLF